MCHCGRPILCIHEQLKSKQAMETKWKTMCGIVAICCMFSVKLRWFFAEINEFDTEIIIFCCLDNFLEYLAIG